MLHHIFHFEEVSTVRLESCHINPVVYTKKTCLDDIDPVPASSLSMATKRENKLAL